MNYTKTSPCDSCPFRSDIPPFLRSDRREQISRELERGGEFPCHKTTVEDEDELRLKATEKSQFCAGALILQERMGQPNQIMRIAERMGMYDASKLDMKAPVFGSFEEFIVGQVTRSKNKSTRKVHKVKKSKNTKRAVAE